MTLHMIAIGLLVLAALCVVKALLHARAARQCLRDQRTAAATLRGFWMMIALALGGVFGSAALLLNGYHQLGSEALIADVSTRQLAPQRYAVDLSFPDGRSRRAEISGDQWQLDARVVKWRSSALLMGAQPLYKLDRLSGRYARINDAGGSNPPVDLAGDGLFDLASVKRRFPHWLPWIDADYGSAAFLPLVDNGRYTVTLSAAGGLIARPADAATEDAVRASGW